jgi:hypothetical protein
MVGLAFVSDISMISLNESRSSIFVCMVAVGLPQILLRLVNYPTATAEMPKNQQPSARALYNTITITTHIPNSILNSIIIRVAQDPFHNGFNSTINQNEGRFLIYPSLITSRNEFPNISP